MSPALEDWSSYELLVMNVYNPTDKKIMMSFEACDAKSGIDKERPSGITQSGWRQRLP